jgi:hypothetical protein
MRAFPVCLNFFFLHNSDSICVLNGKSSNRFKIWPQKKEEEVGGIEIYSVKIPLKRHHILDVFDSFTVE